MKPARPPTYWITQASLLLLAALLVVRLLGMEPLNAGIALIVLAVTPLVLLSAFGLRPQPLWGSWVAVWMLPYFIAAVGEMLIRPLSWWTLTWPALTVVAFFAGLDATRRGLGRTLSVGADPAHAGQTAPSGAAAPPAKRDPAHPGA